jgi:hypothetical protein
MLPRPRAVAGRWDIRLGTGIRAVESTILADSIMHPGAPPESYLHERHIMLHPRWRAVPSGSSCSTTVNRVFMQQIMQKITI